MSEQNFLKLDDILNNLPEGQPISQGEINVIKTWQLRKNPASLYNPIGERLDCTGYWGCCDCGCENVCSCDSNTSSCGCDSYCRY